MLNYPSILVPFKRMSAGNKNIVYPVIINLLSHRVTIFSILCRIGTHICISKTYTYKLLSETYVGISSKKYFVKKVFRQKCISSKIDG